jgi:hypothetical protein
MSRSSRSASRDCTRPKRNDRREERNEHGRREVSMTTDAWLAIAHHLAVFSLAAVLAAE